MLELIEICKSYSSGDAGEREIVLDNINLTLAAGETLSVTGPSGSGKTTLLNIIGTLDKPDSGKVLFNGNDIVEYDENQQAGYRRNDVGIVFQEHNLLGQCTVMENMLLPVLAGGKVSDEIRGRAEQLLEAVSLSEKKNRFPGELSGGQCQRVALARAFINQPKLILADEPTGSLDKTNAKVVVDMLCELSEKNNTSVILVTHDMQVAVRMRKQFVIS